MCFIKLKDENRKIIYSKTNIFKLILHFIQSNEYILYTFLCVCEFCLFFPLFYF